MKKIVFLFAILLCSISASALDIPAGTFYFDNSLTQYSNVKFVYGRDDSKETYVVSMTKDEGSLWKITFSNAVTNMYRYTFAATTLPDGKINNTFSNVKDSISNKLNEKAHRHHFCHDNSWRHIYSHHWRQLGAGRLEN
jgi:hypothetical protein